MTGVARGLRFLLVLFRHMVADSAATQSTDNPMMPCGMTGNAANHRTLDAAFGVGRGRHAGDRDASDRDCDGAAN